ncbi:MAG: HEPN domain-containing protein [Sedimentisphaerales bacterium]|nr:HEPN domain-containing protein [Sedimentisphaerales bacterium]
MSDEATAWLQYARENLEVAKMTLEAGLLNPCLQNAQQAAEKALKTIRVCRSMRPKRTHSIRDLNRELITAGFDTSLSEDDCELLDSIYVSSKYPLESVLPDAPPDLAICQHCVRLAEQVLIVAENVAKE